MFVFTPTDVLGLIVLGFMIVVLLGCLLFIFLSRVFNFLKYHFSIFFLFLRRKFSRKG